MEQLNTAHTPHTVDTGQSQRFCNQLEKAIEQSRSTSQIDNFVKQSYQFLADGLLEEAHVSSLHTLACLRRDVLRTHTVANRIPQKAGDIRRNTNSCYPEKIYRKMPVHKKPEYMARRRELATSGMIPRELGKYFTTGALATLAVIAQEVAVKGSCRLSLGKLAALSGVCTMTCRRAIALALKHKLLDVSLRKQTKGRKNLTNIVQVMNRSWLQWIDKRFRKQGERTSIMKEMLSKLKLPPLTNTSFEYKDIQKCYPTLSTNIIYGNRLVADYSIFSQTANLTVYAPPT